MTDLPLIHKRLLRIETCLADLRQVEVDRLDTDRREERFAEHTLQIAIQAAMDVAAHIVADDKLGDPGTNHELFALIARSGWLPDGLVPSLRRMVGFRNILVHEYETVDLGILRRIVETHASDLQGFVDAIRAKLT